MESAIVQYEGREASVPRMNAVPLPTDFDVDSFYGHYAEVCFSLKDKEHEELYAHLEYSSGHKSVVVISPEKINPDFFPGIKLKESGRVNFRGWIGTAFSCMNSRMTPPEKGNSLEAWVPVSGGGAFFLFSEGSMKGWR